LAIVGHFDNILIVRTDRIGDVILTTPAIEALRKAYPRSKISILVSPLTRELVEGNPFLDEVIVDDRLGQHKGFCGFFQLARILKQKKFDLAIIFHTKKRSNALCFFARIPRRIGYHNNKFGFLLTDKIKDARHYGLKHEAEYCLDVLKYMGVHIDTVNLHLPVSQAAEEWAEQFLKDTNILDSEMLIAIHPGASCPTKRWPVKRFADLMQRLDEDYGARIVMIGSNDVRGIAEEIRALVQKPFMDLSGKTTVGALVSLLRRCVLLISNDSGPVHIAAAVGIPVISIFTRDQPGINPQRWRPLGSKGIAVCPKIKQEITFVKGKKIDDAFLGSIQTADVLEAVDSIFKLC